MTSNDPGSASTFATPLGASSPWIAAAFTTRWRRSLTASLTSSSARPPAARRGALVVSLIEAVKDLERMLEDVLAVSSRQGASMSVNVRA